VGDHVGLAQAWRLVGLVHATACRFGAAEDATRMAIEHARRAGDRRQEIRNLHSYAQYALYGPMPVAEALARCEEVMAQAEGDRRTEGLVTGYLAHLHAMGGSFERARALSARSRAVLEDLGERVTAASTALDGGPVELLAGDYVAAERELRRDAEALEAMGERYLLSTVAALLAQALYAQGRLEDAESYTRVSEETAAHDDVESQVIWRCARGKVLARRGMLDEGETLLREAVELIMETEEPDVQGHVLMDLAQVLLLAQRPEEAASVAERALSLYLAKGNAVSAARAGALMDEAGARAGWPGLEPATDGL
jgi:tetratricopeptide (TPR) repeat protein